MSRRCFVWSKRRDRLWNQLSRFRIVFPFLDRLVDQHCRISQIRRGLSFCLRRLSSTRSRLESFAAGFSMIDGVFAMDSVSFEANDVRFEMVSGACWSAAACCRCWSELFEGRRRRRNGAGDIPNANVAVSIVAAALRSNARAFANATAPFRCRRFLLRDRVTRQYQLSCDESQLADFESGATESGCEVPSPVALLL